MKNIKTNLVFLITNQNKSSSRKQNKKAKNSIWKAIKKVKDEDEQNSHILGSCLQEERNGIDLDSFWNIEFRNQIPDVFIVTIFLLFGNDVLDYYLEHIIQLPYPIRLTYKKYYGLQLEKIKCRFKCK